MLQLYHIQINKKTSLFYYSTDTQIPLQTHPLLPCFFFFSNLKHHSSISRPSSLICKHPQALNLSLVLFRIKTPSSLSSFRFLSIQNPFPFSLCFLSSCWVVCRVCHCFVSPSQSLMLLSRLGDVEFVEVVSYLACFIEFC